MKYKIVKDPKVSNQGSKIIIIINRNFVKINSF